MLRFYIHYLARLIDLTARCSVCNRQLPFGLWRLHTLVSLAFVISILTQNRIVFPACRKSSFSIRQISDTHTIRWRRRCLQRFSIKMKMNNCFFLRCSMKNSMHFNLYFRFIHTVFLFSAIIRHRMQKRMAAAISFLLCFCRASAAKRWRVEKIWWKMRRVHVRILF